MPKPSLQSQLKLLNAQYKLKMNQLQMGEEQWEIYSIANYDDLLDELLNRDKNDIHVKDERIPYWAEIWPSSIALARYIQSSATIDSNSSVLEIGCGLGLSGLSALKKGANVLFTDYLPEPLELVKLNSLNLTGKLPSCSQLDWRAINLETNYDYILAADVAYEERAFEDLLACFQYFVHRESTILLSEPNRHVAKKFILSLKASDFRISQLDLEISFQQLISKISIYQIQK